MARGAPRGARPPQRPGVERRPRLGAARVATARAARGGGRGGARRGRLPPPASTGVSARPLPVLEPPGSARRAGGAPGRRRAGGEPPPGALAGGSREGGGGAGVWRGRAPWAQGPQGHWRMQRHRRGAAPHAAGAQAGGECLPASLPPPPHPGPPRLSLSLLDPALAPSSRATTTPAARPPSTASTTSQWRASLRRPRAQTRLPLWTFTPTASPSAAAAPPRHASCRWRWRPQSARPEAPPPPPPPLMAGHWFSHAYLSTREHMPFRRRRPRLPKRSAAMSRLPRTGSAARARRG
jgi:hypothetical protein